MKNRPFLAAIAMSSFVSIFPSFGYTVAGQSWTRNRTLVMHLSLPPGRRALQDGSGSLGESAEDALNIWNQYLVHMKFAVDRNSILPPEGHGGDTSVLISNAIYGEAFGSGVLAVTMVISRNSTMVEADVIFDSAGTFDSYRGNLQPGQQDFHRIALHEFGHVVGLDHPDQAGLMSRSFPSPFVAFCPRNFA